MKKLILSLVVAIASLSLFAQNVKSTGLTDNDVKSFIKNYTTIKIGLEKNRWIRKHRNWNT